MGTRPKIVHAARVLVYINGKLFGICTSFSWNSMTPRKKIRTIDIPHAVELAATTSDVSFNMGVLRTVGDGGMQGPGVVATQSDLSKEKYFSVLLLERESDLPLFKADLCQTEAEQWAVTAKGLLLGQISCSGVLWGNEAS